MSLISQNNYFITATSHTYFSTAYYGHQKNQNSVLRPFCEGIHWWSLDFPGLRTASDDEIVPGYDFTIWFIVKIYTLPLTTGQSDSHFIFTRL